MALPVALAVTEASQVGEARRAATNLASRLGFGETEAGRAALVVTEVANNLVKHARSGQILLRALDGEVPAIELLALDRGPGMADVARCLQDGYSTAGSPGTGLGAIARLSACMDLYSQPDLGTALLVRLYAASRGCPDRLYLGVVCVPVSGEVACGDAWAVEQDGERVLIMVADGLGHGPRAEEAARTAVRIFRDNLRLPCEQILQAAHLALRSTRGGAVAIAEIDPAGETLRYAGVGNIAGCVLVGGASRSMVSHNGTLGHEAQRFQAFDYPFPRGATLVMHSDGLGSRWSLDPYPGLLHRDPALLTGILYRDFRRPRDDTTVLAVRENLGGKGP